MRSLPQRPEPLGAIWLLLCVSLLILCASTGTAYGAVVKKAKSSVAVKKVAPKPKVFSGDYPVTQIKPVTAPVAVPAPSVASAVPAPSLSAVATDVAPPRVMNFRIHPIHLVDMLAKKDTLISLRTDLDVVLGGGVTVGPSVIFHRTSAWDDSAVAGGNVHSKDEDRFEVGLLSNVYVYGNTREGGFVIRPHVYYVDVNGERTDEAGTLAGATSAKAGWRMGGEFLYQKILPAGLNFEVGGGFTYHVVPYSVEYQGGARTAPEHPVEPTVTVGIGWAF